MTARSFTYIMIIVVISSVSFCALSACVIINICLCVTRCKQSPKISDSDVRGNSPLEQPTQPLYDTVTVTDQETQQERDLETLKNVAYGPIKSAK